MFELLAGMCIYVLGVVTGVGGTLLVLWLLDKSYAQGKRDAK